MVKFHYIFSMTIEQTIEIPVSRRIFLDLPPELPVGKAKITVTSDVETRNIDLDNPDDELFGIWRNRKDMEDPEQYIRTMRKGRKL